MKQKWLMALALLGMGSMPVLLIGADPAPAQAVRWEYAAYRAMGNRYQWQTPETEVSARNLADFQRQLGLRRGMTDESLETELINHFGHQGWERVPMTPPGDTRGTWIFWFKQPAH